MLLDLVRFHPSPVLLVRPTGGGKSATRDVSGLLAGGVVLNIVPLLSLGADQEKKIQFYPSEFGIDADSIHID